MHTKTKTNAETPQTKRSTLTKIDQQPHNHRIRTDNSLNRKGVLNAFTYAKHSP